MYSLINTGQILVPVAVINTFPLNLFFLFFFMNHTHYIPSVFTGGQNYPLSLQTLFLQLTALDLNKRGTLKSKKVPHMISSV